MMTSLAELFPNIQLFCDEEYSAPCSHDPILSQLNPVQTLLKFIFKLSFHLRQAFESGLFHSRLPTVISYAFLTSMRADSVEHVIPDFITEAIYSENYKL
jgi:hypothetical protein